MATTTEETLDIINIPNEGADELGLNVPGLIAVIIFYLVILVVGLWAGWQKKRRTDDGGEGKGIGVSEEAIIARRDVGLFVGCLTMTATWVGGGYINGSAEAMFSSGLVWCQAPIGYSVSLTLGGLFFARKMRERRYVTMMDPLQECFGHRWGAVLYLPSLAGDILYSSSILAALGSTLSVILNLSNTVSIFSSAAIAVVYTMFGGLYAVMYTDIVQLFCIFIGLWIAIPFAMTHEAVGSLSLNTTDWLGSINPETPWVWGEWTDSYILLIFGGIPCQIYFQRVLAARTGKQAQQLSYFGTFGCIFLVIPACIIGAIAKATDWEKANYSKDITQEDQKKLVLPLVLQYLTPPWVALFGLGAVSAAVMSSVDSTILSASSMFVNNVYKNVIRTKASDRELIWVMRIAIVVVASCSSYIAILGNSIYALFYLCSDFVFVMLLPQLTMAVHFPTYVNTYGSICGYFLGFILRILGGEKVLGILPVIQYPYFIDNVQYFPFRTLSMLVTTVTLLAVSWFTQKLYDVGVFKDFLGVLTKDSVPEPTRPGGDASMMKGSHGGGLDNPALEASPSRGKKADNSLYSEASYELTKF